MMMVESWYANEVSERFIQNPMVFCGKVKSNDDGDDG